MSSDDTPKAPKPRSYSPDQITLYGIRLNELNANGRTAKPAYLPFDGNRLKMAVVPFNLDDPVPPGNGVIAVIYGYAFEGGCYRFDKPKVLIFRSMNIDEDAEGCGFDNLGYAMWRLSKKDRMMELSSEIDLAEQIVLNANLPGNRSPNSYGNSFMMAHRGGRLNRGGGNQS